MSANTTGAEAIYRKLVFGERATLREQAPPAADPDGAASGALPGGVSGGEDFSANQAETP